MFSITRRVQIEWGHCDPAGIVFNPRFFEYFDWSTALLFERALGITKAEAIRKYDAVGIPIVQSHAKFLAPCRYGDTVEIVSAIVKLGRSSFDVQHRLANRGELAVEAFETRVWTGPDPDDRTRIKARPLPPEVVERFGSSVDQQL